MDSKPFLASDPVRKGVGLCGGCFEPLWIRYIVISGVKYCDQVCLSLARRFDQQ